jgi:hypothetical protein
MPNNVVALIRIEEQNFAGRSGFHTHACAGDRGRVVAREGEFVTIRWERTETISTCHHTEVIRHVARVC